MEKFYKTLRKDLGYDDIENNEISKSENVEVKEDKEDDGTITDNKKLNDLIKQAMLNKEDKKK